MSNDSKKIEFSRFIHDFEDHNLENHDIFSEEEPSIPVNNCSKRRLSRELPETQSELSNAARYLRATMPDQTRRVLQAVQEYSEVSSQPEASNLDTGCLTPSPRYTASAQSSPKLYRRYSQAQKDLDDNSQSSSVDENASLEIFQKSILELSASASTYTTPTGYTSRLARRRSSPDLQRSFNLNSNPSALDQSRSLRDSSHSQQSEVPKGPGQGVLSKIAGVSGGKSSSFFWSLSQNQNRSESSSSNLGAATTDTESYSAVATMSSKEAACQKDTVTKFPSSSGSGNLDSVDANKSASMSSSSNSGFLATTRRFGAWLSSTVEGDKMEVTKKDLNVFAPTTF